MKINLRLAFRRLAIVSGLCLGLVSQAFLYGTWVEPPVTVSDPANNVDPAQDAPVMVVNNLGNAISIWNYFTVGSDNELDNVASSFFTQATGWSPQVTISSLALAPPLCGGPLYIDQFNPDIAMNDSNYAIAVWEANLIDCNVFPFVMLAARSTNGIWNPIETLALDPSGNLFPKQANVSVNNAGNGLAAWRTLDQIANTYRTTVVFIPFMQPAGALFSFPLESALGSLSKPFPVINENGNAVVVWEFELPSFTFGIYAATFNASTNTWTGPIALDTIAGPFPSQISKNPRCAMDDNGNAVAIWQINFEVRVAYFNGTNWETPITLAPASTSDDTVDVVMDPQGNATAVWQGDTPDFFVFSSSRLPDGTWTAPEIIGQSNYGDGFNVDLSHNPLAVNELGDVIAGWLLTPDTMQAAIKPFGQAWQPSETVFNGDLQLINQNVGISSCGLAIAMWGSRLVTPEGQNRVKATINNTSLIEPPLNPTLKQCCTEFATHTKCFNLLQWSTNCPVISFKIFRNGVLIANVPNVPPLAFVDSVCKRGGETYTISAVSSSGAESIQVPFVVTNF